MTEQERSVRLVRPIAGLIAPLSVKARIVLLEALLAQEICNLPPSERDDAMRDHLREFPTVLDVTEATMRLALVVKARNGFD